MSKINQYPNKFLTILSVTCTLLLILGLLRICNYGFDFTDEGYTLNWISHPFNYPESLTQFGFIYHPLYLLVDGNIVLLRQINFLTTFFLAWTLSWLILNNALKSALINQFQVIIISASIASSSALSAVFAGMWLPYLSYNSLSFQGLTIICIGLILANKYLTRKSIFGWILIGIGGWLTLMGKPTTAVNLGLLSILFLLFSGKLRFSLLFIAMITALTAIVCFGYVVDDGLMNLYLRYKGGVEIANLFQANSKSIFRLEDLNFNKLAI